MIECRAQLKREIIQVNGAIICRSQVFLYLSLAFLCRRLI